MVDLSNLRKTLNANGKDMSSQDVQSHGVAIKLSNWVRYADSDDRFSANRVAEICEEIQHSDGCVITRGYVRQAFSQSFAKGVIASVIWGYPKGRFPGGRPFDVIFAKAETLANRLEKLKSGKLLKSVDICSEFDGFQGLGPSTYTKMLYFADVAAIEGGCLIYDQMVMRAIAQIGEPQWADIKTRLGSCRHPNGKFRTYPQALQVETYGVFLGVAHSLATREKNAEAIELELFTSAPRGKPTQHKKG